MSKRKVLRHIQVYMIRVDEYGIRKWWMFSDQEGEMLLGKSDWSQSKMHAMWKSKYGDWNNLVKFVGVKSRHEARVLLADTQNPRKEAA